ncbi:phytoene desaturase family protein [Salipaludibacillus sp. CF4.18]|uniref:phytoene desaturase family protein n=1 Tax=Salipaludibacillus sp. CF4.18 TaxID=3373081 RepID=UPI003EE4DAF7
MTKQKAIVIGGGLAGLSAAIKLQFDGFDTLIIEKNSVFGGKLHEVTLGTHRFDFGPNVITMPHVFQNVISNVGLNPDDYFEFIKLDTHTKNEFPDGSSFYFSSNKERMISELASVDSYAAKHYPAYLKEVERLYKLSNNYFLHRTFSSWKDYLSLPLTKAMLTANPIENLDHFHRRFFKDERVIRAFNRYATYIGSSPYNAPATFALIGHLELSQGVFFTKGGNHNIAKGFVQAAKELGVTLIENEEVIEIHTKESEITGLETNAGEYYEADVFVLNGDLLSQYPRLIRENERPSFSNKKVNKLEPSISAFVILAATSKRFDLHHHQIMFGDHIKEEFNDIFHNGKYGSDPSIYLCTSAKTDPTLSPDGDNIYILVNAPPLRKNGTQQIDPKLFEEKIYTRLEQRGLDITSSLIDSKVVDPKQISSRFNAYRGALYGLASNKRKDAFLRPYNRSKDIHNLYFAGGSTHPGGGSPMVVLSGQNIANLITKNHRH